VVRPPLRGCELLLVNNLLINILCLLLTFAVLFRIFVTGIFGIQGIKMIESAGLLDGLWRFALVLFFAIKFVDL
jgi:hypothetical protein